MSATPHDRSELGGDIERLLMPYEVKHALDEACTHRCMPYKDLREAVAKLVAKNDAAHKAALLAAVELIPGYPGNYEVVRAAINAEFGGETT